MKLSTTNKKMMGWALAMLVGGLLTSTLRYIQQHDAPLSVQPKSAPSSFIPDLPTTPDDWTPFPGQPKAIPFVYGGSREEQAQKYWECLNEHTIVNRTDPYIVANMCAGKTVDRWDREHGKD